MEFISDRISVERQEDALSVVIEAKLTDKNRWLLLGWLALWTVCGMFFLWELFRSEDRELKVPLFVLLGFWVYYEFRVLRTFLWRSKGFELWRLRDGELTIKNSLYRFGKANRYFVANIKRFGPLNMDKTSWKWQMSDSFWTRGAEQLGFEYHDKKVAFGRGLTEEEAKKLAYLLTGELKRERKAESRQSAEVGSSRPGHE